jgi:hypothetical protein
MAEKYNIAKVAGVCCVCQRKMEPREPLVTTIREVGEQLERWDYCLTCWDSDQRPGEAEILGMWRTRIPEPQQKKKLLVDDEVLLGFFTRLAGAEQPERIAFRYVLTLILMRKRLLEYQGTTRDGDGCETWTLRRRGSDETYEVIDPNLDEDRIAEVSEQLNQILETEL